MVLEEDGKDQLNRLCEKKHCMEVRGKGTSLHIIKLRKDDWIGHILRRNVLLKHVTEGKIKKI